MNGNINNNVSSNFENTKSLILKQLKENWFWYFILGVGLIILGSLAIGFSLISTIFSVIYLGLFLIVVGFIEGIKSFKINKWSGFFLHLLLGILYIACGAFIVYNPIINAMSLTLLLAFFFMVIGVLRIVYSFSRNTLHRGWLAFNGVLTLILGILIWAQWPVSALWVIGTFLGIDTILTGWTWIMLSIKAKNLK